MKFVIIGGDAAGMSAASRAKRNQSDLKVTVFEQSQDVSYSACGMPYNIADPDRKMNDLVVRSAQAFREKQNIDLKLGHRVTSIDPKTKTIEGQKIGGEDFRFDYDKLLIATGASPIIPDLPGFELPGIMTLKSLEDGRNIKEKIQEARKVIILGMGYVGLEMAEALRARKIEVDMIKERSQLLPWLSPALAEVVEKELLAHGVGLYPGHEVKSIEKKNSGLKVVCEDLILEGDLVLVAIGIRPNSQLAENAGLALGPSHSIAVDRMLRTSDHNIFSAGDCADAFHVVSEKRVWIPLALRANRGGWAVADNVAGLNTELQGIAGTAVFKVFDLEVARTGLTANEARDAGFDPDEITITGRSRAHAHPGSSQIHVNMIGDRLSGRLLGAQLVGKDGVAHRIDAPAVALHSRMTVEEFYQTDLAYAPPFSPVWDPMLTAANQLLKKL
ncbi:MAG: FAD-dependent oxidoreductase [Desulfobacterales bacterium]|jgi:NADPH-dependent 2,4-dienoyl-CoA reductase/sulfur reductase-like enzyme